MGMQMAVTAISDMNQRKRMGVHTKEGWLDSVDKNLQLETKLKKFMELPANLKPPTQLIKRTIPKEEEGAEVKKEEGEDGKEERKRKRKSRWATDDEPEIKKEAVDDDEKPYQSRSASREKEPDPEKEKEKEKEPVAQNTEMGIETGIGTEIGEVVLEERIEMIEEAVPGVEETIETKREVDLVVMIEEEETKICGDMTNMMIQIEVVIVDVMEAEMEAVEKETEIVALEVMIITDTMIDNEM